jgi:Ni/Co efflux regulator RcnB
MNKILTILALITLTACGDEAAQKQQANTESATQKHMLSDQEKMIQKAKDAEEKIKKAEEKRRQAIKDQGG